MDFCYGGSSDCLSGKWQRMGDQKWCLSSIIINSQYWLYTINYDLYYSLGWGVHSYHSVQNPSPSMLYISYTKRNSFFIKKIGFHLTDQQGVTFSLSFILFWFNYIFFNIFQTPFFRTLYKVHTISNYSKLSLINIKQTNKYSFHVTTLWS